MISENYLNNSNNDENLYSNIIFFRDYPFEHEEVNREFFNKISLNINKKNEMTEFNNITINSDLDKLEVKFN